MPVSFKRGLLVGSFSFFALFIGIQVAHASRVPCPTHVACSEGDMENCSCNVVDIPELGVVYYLKSWNAGGMYCYFNDDEECGDEQLGVHEAANCYIRNDGLLDPDDDGGECYVDDYVEDEGEAVGSQDTVTYDGKIYTLDCWNAVLEEGFDERDAVRMCSSIRDEETDESYECWSDCLADGGEEYDCTEDCGYNYGEEEELDTHCASDSADRGPFPQNWNAYSCQDSNAGGCLSRSDYTSTRGMGCPGSQYCCPPLFTGDPTDSEDDNEGGSSGLGWGLGLLAIAAAAGGFFYYRKKDQS